MRTTHTERVAGQPGTSLGLFADHPDVPRVARALTVRTGVAASMVLHAAGVLVFLFAPSAWWESSATATALIPPPQETLRYVHIAPMVDRSATPTIEAPASDRDRRSSTTERTSEPKNALPFSRGDTPERVEGTGGGERPLDPVPPPSAANTTTPPATEPPPTEVPVPPDKTLPESVLVAPPAEPDIPNLLQSLRSLRDTFRTQNFDNQQGGGTQPGADIQFDSKGVDFGPWLRRFRAQIYRNWFVPQAAMVNKGRVVLTFFVHRDGRITDVEVVQAAATNSFNISSANAIRMSTPTLPLPDEYPLDKIFFTVTFHYNER